MKNVCVITVICTYLRTPLSNLWKNVVFCFILTFLFHASFHSAPAFATGHTAVVIRSQAIAAYSEAIKGFEEGCKRNNISIDTVYDLKGDVDEGKRVIKNIKVWKPINFL